MEDWQLPYRFGTIVIWPPQSVREAINAQRQEYDPASQRICETHITVTQPLIRLLIEDEWVQIRRLLKSFGSFEIRYGPLGSFLPYPCIFYEIEPKEKVLEIRRTLHNTGCFNLGLSHTEDFVPHMTITEGLSGPEVDEQLLRRLRGESNQGSFICHELMFIVPKDPFVFRAVRALPLGGH